MSVFYANLDVDYPANVHIETPTILTDVSMDPKLIYTTEAKNEVEDCSYEKLGAVCRNQKMKSVINTGTTDQTKNNINNVKDSPYELVQNFLPENYDIKKVPSISDVKRVSRDYGDFDNCGLSMRESLIGFKEGVPGIFSGFKPNNKYKRKSESDIYVKNTTDVISHQQRPPRTNRPKTAFVGFARIYDLVNNDDFLEEPLVDTDSLEEENKDMERISENRHVLVNAGTSEAGRVETSIRYYDPTTDLPRRPSSAVVLPMSLAEDMSDSGDDESWGSEFEDSMSEIFDKDNEIYEVLGEPREKGNSDYEDIDKIICQSKSEKKLPPLPPRRSVILETFLESRDLDDTYIPVEMDDEQRSVTLPPLPNAAEEYQVKRHQIIKCIIENESIYMRTLQKLIKEYEEPVVERKLISFERCKIIFLHIHELLQCHQLFNMGLSARISEWESREVIGDVMYASFSKSMVLKAYSSFVSNFPIAMDSIKETCKLVPAFFKFLKNRLYRNNTKQSLYDLMRQPLERIPQLVILTQALVKITPLNHPDRSPLQMALTHFECLSETLAEKRKDSLCKHKVRQLDGYCTDLEKPLSSKKRYYVRHDDMLLCMVENSKVVKTKLRRIFVLNDLLICTSILNKQKQLRLMTKKKYKVKWCIPISDVNVIDVGTGISIIVHDKVTTIKYSHPISSPRPGYEQSSQLLEDLQHDIAIIGEIAGKVAQLRKSYRFLDSEKVSGWYKDVKKLLDHETELANMHWIELSIPVRGMKNERIQCLFNVHSPSKKLEWTAELADVKLRLHENNNPGWYLQENVYDGETAVLRRTLPLVSNISTLFMIEAKYSVQCVLPISTPTSADTILWVFSGNEHVGLITLMEMNMNAHPHVIESFIACQSRICCAELVEETVFMPIGERADQKKLTVWIGTMSGSIFLYNLNDSDKTACLSVLLKDAVVSLKYAMGKMFAGLANGTIACFRRRIDCEWDLRNPTVIVLGSCSILSLTVANYRLWCACGSDIIILDTNTLGIIKKIDSCDLVKGNVRNLVAYGTGVWVSIWKSSKLQLYHAETLDLLQTITTTTPISRMKNDVDGRVQGINIEKIYVTAVLAKHGLLWVGLDQGLIVTYPLPRLGGIPTVSGQACVSFHTHDGPVKHLISFQQKKPVIPIVNPKEEETQISAIDPAKQFHGSSQFLCGSLSEISSIYGGQEDQNNTEYKQSLEPVYFVVEPESEDKKSVFTDENSMSDTQSVEIVADRIDENNHNIKPSNSIVHDDQDFDMNNPLPSSAVANDQVSEVEQLTNSNLVGERFDVELPLKDYFIVDNLISSTPTPQHGAKEKELTTERYVGDNLVVTGKYICDEVVQVDVMDEHRASTENKVDVIDEHQASTENKVDVMDEHRAITENKVDVMDEHRASTENKVDIMDEHQASSENKVVVNVARKLFLPIDHKDFQNGIDEYTDNKKNTVAETLNSGRDRNDEEDEEMLEKPWMETEEKDDDAKNEQTTNELLENNMRERDAIQEHSTDLKDLSLLSVKSKSSSGYELPLTTPEIPIGVSYAVVDKLCNDSSEYDVASNKTLETFYEEYKSMPLPNSPSRSHISCNTSSNSFYMPLASEITNQNDVSNSLTSSIGFRSYDKEDGFPDNNSVRSTNESYYASLVAVSKQEAESRKEYLLEPTYVVSVGVGHVDLRKKDKTSGKNGFDFIRSFSYSAPEHLLITWKI